MSYLYIIRAGDTDCVKIGMARSPRDRLRQLQNANHERLRLEAAWPATYREEGLLHEKLRAHKRRGEWFNFCLEIQELIDKNPLPKRLKVHPHPDFA